MPVRPRDAGSVRYVDHARSGHDVGQPVDTRRTSTTQNLALAAATAREALIAMASRRGSALPASDLAVADGVVAVTSDPARRVTYGELVGGKAFRSAARARTRGASRRANGPCSARRMPRVDMPAMATGQLEYVHNVRVPGMLHGRVVRPPAVGATLDSVDEALRARTCPASSRSSSRRTSSASSPRSRGRRSRRRAALKATLDARHRAAAPARFLRSPAQRSRRATRSSSTRRTSTQTLGARRDAWCKATYLHPYQMHGSIGSSCAVADVRAERPPSGRRRSRPIRLRSGVGDAARPAARNACASSSRAAPAATGSTAPTRSSYDAALLSQAVGRPVRVQLSRKDEMAWENYGCAFVDRSAGRRSTRRRHHRRVGLRGVVADARRTARLRRAGQRRHRHRSPASSRRRSRRAPAPPPAGRFNNGSNAAPSYVTGCVGGACGGTGTVDERARADAHGAIRRSSPDRCARRRGCRTRSRTNASWTRSRRSVKADPVEYRLRHLRDPRLSEVVTAAAKAAAGSRVRRRGRCVSATGVARGRGIACVLYEGDNGYCAMVAEVDVDQRTGASRSSGWWWRTTAGRSRIPTA